MRRRRASSASSFVRTADWAPWSPWLTWLPPAEDELVAAELGEAALDLFGHAPDGVWMAPGRVNLIGEHTDYNAGLSLPFALPHRTYAAVRRRRDGVLRIASVQMGGIGWEGRVEEVRPGFSAGWPAYVAGVFAALSEWAEADEMGADVLVDGRVPLEASGGVDLDGLRAEADELFGEDRIDDDKG